MCIIEMQNNVLYAHLYRYLCFIYMYEYVTHTVLRYTLLKWLPCCIEFEKLGNYEITLSFRARL